MDQLTDFQNSMNRDGMTVEIQRKNPDGSYTPISETQKNMLSTQSKITNVAKNVENLTPIERTKWAIELKNAANELYHNKQYTEAMQEYINALTASNFNNTDTSKLNLNKSSNKSNNSNNNTDSHNGSTTTSSTLSTLSTSITTTHNNDDDNVEDLVIPILNNLSICCFHLQQYSKSIQFSKQILLLNNNNRKAVYRIGRCLFERGEFHESITKFTKFINLSKIEEENLKTNTNTNTSSSEALRAEIASAIIFISKCKQGVEKERGQMRRRKKGMQRAFHNSSSSSSSNDSNNDNQINIKNNSNNSNIIIIIIIIMVIILKYYIIF